MKHFSEIVETEMNRKFHDLSESQITGVQYAEEAVRISIESYEQLKTVVKLIVFKSVKEEIAFFKEIKPLFSSKLIYYNEIFRIETAIPRENKKAILQFYKTEEKCINDFYKNNLDFYKYYRSQNTNRDKQYFTRRKPDIKTGINLQFFQNDFDFNTTHDFLVARIIANDLIQVYLNKKKKELKTESNKVIKESYDLANTGINWTGSKVALIELVYALHTSGVINNGRTSLNKLISNIEVIFNFKLNQFNRVFIEIKNRKSIDQTAFLNSLKDNLTKRINDSET